MEVYSSLQQFHNSLCPVFTIHFPTTALFQSFRNPLEQTLLSCSPAALLAPWYALDSGALHCRNGLTPTNQQALLCLFLLGSPKAEHTQQVSLASLWANNQKLSQLSQPKQAQHNAVLPKSLQPQELRPNFTP